MGAVASLVEDSGDGGVDFVRLVEKIGSRRPCNRLVAARTFTDVLFMATKNKIAVEQKTAYGNIQVSLPASAAA
jgi:chromatin segregation and condensation protein Rec8/ScpA/Scc1 (kleisin family)